MSAILTLCRNGKLLTPDILSGVRRQARYSSNKSLEQERAVYEDPSSLFGEEVIPLAATAEFAPQVFEGERYCASLSAEHEWYGLMALRAAGVEVDQVMFEAVVENAFDDHMTALTENMVTDEEYAEELVFGTPKVREIVDGHVVSKTGRPLYDIVETGAKHSQKLAESDPVFQHQADRDEGDRQFMETIDSLEVGEVAHVVSLDPKLWYVTHRELCDSIGYREGMAIQHVAYRSDEHAMLMWTYAIKQSDADAIAQIYSENFETDIPAGTNPDLWSRHVHRAKMPQAWAEQIGPRTLERHTELTGSDIQHYSIDEFMAENVGIIRQIFDAYIPRIATAINTKENDVELQALAQNILTTAGQGLKSEVRRKLIEVANSSSFDDDSGRLMKVMIRYATLEKLRTKIPDYKARIDKRATTKDEKPAVHTSNAAYSFVPYDQSAAAQQVQALSRMMAQDIAVGVAARRSVGGCSGISISEAHREMLGSIPGDRPDRPYNDMFSRADSMDPEKQTADDEDEFGPLTFKCTKGHTNTRPRARTKDDLLTVCQTDDCKGSVGCG